MKKAMIFLKDILFGVFASILFTGNVVMIMMFIADLSLIGFKDFIIFYSPLILLNLLYLFWIKFESKSLKKLTLNRKKYGFKILRYFIGGALFFSIYFILTILTFEHLAQAL